MSPMNLKWKIWGRPIKPVAFALSLTMLVMFGFNATNNGILDGSPEGDILGGFALGVSVLFTYGWVRNAQTATELALIGALFAWTARFWLTVFLVPSPWISEGFWFSIAWAVIAGGSYLLEKADFTVHTTA